MYYIFLSKIPRRDIVEKSRFSNESGIISYARSIVDNIASIAAKEVKGVASLYGSGANSGVKIEFDRSGALIVDISVNIHYGYSAADVAGKIQENVKNSVETMTEYRIQSVNILVLGVTFNTEAN